MKAIMISIKPKWVAKILNGEKTIEIRKTIPQEYLDYCIDSDKKVPIDVYIYCTKEDSLIKLKSGYVKDKYVCEQDFKIDDFPKMYSGYDGKGKVVAKFTLNKIDSGFIQQMQYEEKLDKVLQDSCLTFDDLWEYHENNMLYMWHIDNLEIFDKPKELSEFKHIRTFEPKTMNRIINWRMTRAPQSWCYIEVK